MKIGLAPHDGVREEAEGLDHMALRHLDPAGDAGTFQDAAAPVRLRIPVAAAIAQAAILASNRAEDLKHF
jgi:hypothetical protein